MGDQLAIVIPVVNCFTFTQQAIRSIRCSMPWKIILIDNGSTDETRDQLLPVDAYLRQEKNLGVAASWNLGIDHAFRVGCRQVFVMNNDIVLAEDALDTLLQWRREGLLFPTVRVVPGAPNTLSTARREHRRRLPTEFCGFLIDLEVVGRVGWFDDAFKVAYWEDVDYDYRLKRKNVPRGACMDALAIHYTSTTWRKGGVNVREHFEANRQYLMRKWGKVPDRYS